MPCVSFCLLLSWLLCLCGTAHAAKSSPAQFVFGDSLVDQGNNNHLTSLARANAPPYGLDYPQFDDKPTGRFCNGRIVSDIVSEYLGVEPILAFMDSRATGANLLRGVNFASAGSGILDDTGAIFIQHINMPQQIKDFQSVQGEVSSLIGPSAAQQLFANGVYSLTIGGNDYVNNYLLPGSDRARTMSVSQYTELMISTLRVQVKSLYELGARKISVSAIGPIGCIPSQLATKSVGGECVESVNSLAQGFNSLLKPMLEDLSFELPGSTLVYANAYDIVLDLINNPGNYGFKFSNTACCGAGRFNGLFLCTQISSLCTNRGDYVFWDPFHPTDKANGIVTNRLLFGPPSDISPVNISQLLDLQVDV